MRKIAAMTLCAALLGPAFDLSAQTNRTGNTDTSYQNGRMNDSISHNNNRQQNTQKKNNTEKRKTSGKTNRTNTLDSTYDNSKMNNSTNRP